MKKVAKIIRIRLVNASLPYVIVGILYATHVRNVLLKKL